MPDLGEPRAAARIGVVIVLLAALGGGLWWWKHRRISDDPATSTVTQPQQGSASSTATRRGTAIEPATLVIAVSDDKGPLAGATVRLAPKDGEIVVVKTGATASPMPTTSNRARARPGHRRHGQADRALRERRSSPVP